MQEVEDALVEFLERGANIETDILANLKQALPADVAQQLETMIPPPPSQQPMAYDMPAEAPVVVYTADAVIESQIGMGHGVISSALSLDLLCLKLEISPNATDGIGIA